MHDEESNNYLRRDRDWRVCERQKSRASIIDYELENGALSSRLQKAACALNDLKLLVSRSN